MEKTLYMLLSFLLLNQFVLAEISVKIVDTSGEAKVRFGLEEEWQKAAIGLDLKEIDTILTGENAEIILQFHVGKKFILSSNSILDIGDLREIQEKELFLFLMSKKVENIKPREEKTKLRIGDVSVVHGESKNITDTTLSKRNEISQADKEINGALALFIQKYYTNTLYKLHNLLDKYESLISNGKVYYYIAKAFELLDKKGQAADAYQTVINSFENKDSLNQEEEKYLIESQVALQKLKINN